MYIYIYIYVYVCIYICKYAPCGSVTDYGMRLEPRVSWLCWRLI